MHRMILALLILGGTIACQQNSANQTQAPTEFEVISKGKVVDLLPHISKTGYTVFDFYADWCAPCKKLNESLLEMKAVYGEKLHVVKLDLVDWKSELAVHHQIADLPYLMVYDQNQKLLNKGPSNQVLPELVKLLNR